MPYVYLLQCPYFKKDVFKIGGSEKNGNERLKSYGKGTIILSMIKTYYSTKYIGLV